MFRKLFENYRKSSFLLMFTPFLLTYGTIKTHNSLSHNDTTTEFGVPTHEHTTSWKAYEQFVLLDGGSSLVKKFANTFFADEYYASVDYDGDGLVDRIRTDYYNISRSDATKRQLNLFFDADKHHKELKEKYSN